MTRHKKRSNIVKPASPRPDPRTTQDLADLRAIENEILADLAAGTFRPSRATRRQLAAEARRAERRSARNANQHRRDA